MHTLAGLNVLKKNFNHIVIESNAEWIDFFSDTTKVSSKTEIILTPTCIV